MIPDNHPFYPYCTCVVCALTAATQPAVQPLPLLPAQPEDNVIYVDFRAKRRISPMKSSSCA